MLFPVSPLWRPLVGISHRALRRASAIVAVLTLGFVGCGGSEFVAADQSDEGTVRGGAQSEDGLGGPAGNLDGGGTSTIVSAGLPREDAAVDRPDYVPVNSDAQAEVSALCTVRGQEVCNGIDDDCNGVVDDENAQLCKPFYYDGDRDQYGANSVPGRCLCKGVGAFTATENTDCDDGDKEVHPGAKERCNGKDDGCTGAKDPPDAAGCTWFYRDGEGDGYGLSNDKRCLCGACIPYTAMRSGDCDDRDGDIHPGAAETCNGKDDDCDSVIDPDGAGGCKAYFFDEDGDDYGVMASKKCTCGKRAPYSASAGGDCYDKNPSVHPGQTEFFANHRGDGSFDYNCDGVQSPQLDTVGSCQKTPGSCVGASGWGGTVPQCGYSGQKITGCDAARCLPTLVEAIQACR